MAAISKFHVSYYAKVRAPITLGYAGFYTMHYWMILTAIV
jgi:hypothetical protein